MPACLVAPFLLMLRWLEAFPAVRLVVSLGLLVAAIAISLPGWMLDAWLVLSLGGALAFAILIALAGAELPDDAIGAALPAYLQRFTLHRFALSIALTKAILLGEWAGMIVEWTAHRALAGHVGVALAALGGLFVARWSLGVGPGSTPNGTRSLLALLGRQALAGLMATALFSAAGLVSGLMLQRWAWGPTLANLTLYNLAEGVLASLPGLFASVALARWLGAPRPAPNDASTEEPIPAARLAPLVLECGSAIAPAVGRVLATHVSLVRARLARSPGLNLPAVSLVVREDLAPRTYRWMLRGAVERHGELGEGELPAVIALELERLARARAETLLSLDEVNDRLAALAVAQPILVAHALAAPGLPSIHAVLRGLLRERVPIGDLTGILEAVLAPGAEATGLAGMIEAARRSQIWALGLSLADATGQIRVLELGEGWDEQLAAHLPGDPALAPTGGLTRELATALRQTLARLEEPLKRPVLVVSKRMRPLLAEMVYHGMPEVAVLAPDEISPRCTPRRVGTVERPSLHSVV